MTIWELDFYSRPVVDENNKKRWELLICETPATIDRSSDTIFKYASYCPNTMVNSQWLGEAVTAAIKEAGVTPKKIRFFRRQMNNMISKACEDIGIPASPSRRTHALTRWIEERMVNLSLQDVVNQNRQNLLKSILQSGDKQGKR